MVLALPAFLIVQSVFVPAPTMTRGKVPLNEPNMALLLLNLFHQVSCMFLLFMGLLWVWTLLLDNLWVVRPTLGLVFIGLPTLGLTPRRALQLLSSTLTGLLSYTLRGWPSLLYQFLHLLLGHPSTNARTHLMSNHWMSPPNVPAWTSMTWPMLCFSRIRIRTRPRSLLDYLIWVIPQVYLPLALFRFWPPLLMLF